jgi:hypothetical protein
MPRPEKPSADSENSKFIFFDKIKVNPPSKAPKHSIDVTQWQDHYTRSARWKRE